MGTEALQTIMNATYQNTPLEKPDILAVIEKEGIKFKRRGRDFWAPCPFHTDKTPSFKVSQDKQSFYCFGCNEHGDVIDFIMKRHVLTFKDAMALLGIRKGRMPKPDPQAERQRQLKRAYERWQTVYYWHLCDQAIELHSLRIKAKDRQAPLSEGLAFMVAEALSELPLIEYHLDILKGQDEELKFELFKGVS